MSETIQNPNLENDLLAAFTAGTIEEKIVVKAEDLELGGGGIDYKAIFFEPQPGKTYQVRCVQNGNKPSLVHRSIYKDLPDPERKGKTFNYVSSGIAATCPALELFFELNPLKKNGDALATKKIDDYLKNTNQSCTIVQIITSNDDDYKTGEFRLMVFSSYGPNATISNLINEKTNLSQEKIDAGFEKDDCWNIFEAPILMIVCTESTYDGRKGRDFTKSVWAPKRIGVTVDVDGTPFTFKKEHLADGKLAPEALPAFHALLKVMAEPNLSIHNNFAYKIAGDPENTEETDKYLVKLMEKVNKIIPVIREAKSILEIQNFCKVDPTASTSTESGNKPENILASSLPAELAGSILESNEAKAQEVKQESTPTDAKIEGASNEAMDLLSQL